ncbi:hypothetical protein SHELI_v1c02490 [Spiroplasma helicoides]|uniref:Uncharacterized protein n=1 Tax=Spiroplasma helicoides TaxID=216938 RepID=A0A1B3SJU9_9MOLU|nr:hypothetical protein SHELI_v1c02490 [Spiroplasma helicoides]
MNKRNSSLELLRIILCYFVILNHVWGYNHDTNIFYVFSGLLPVSIMHISTFAFITGFFMVGKEIYSCVKKFTKYLLNIIFYYLFILLMVYLIDHFYYKVDNFGYINHDVI